MAIFRFFQRSTGITVTVTLIPTPGGAAQAQFSAESVLPVPDDQMQAALSTWNDFLADGLKGPLSDRLPPGWRVAGK